jgi:hypothetical protein
MQNHSKIGGPVQAGGRAFLRQAWPFAPLSDQMVEMIGLNS